MAKPSAPRFIWKKTCSTCRDAKKWLEAHGVDTAAAREINADPLSAKELDALIGTRDHKPFLNTRNELYRERDMKTKLPTRAEALALMAEHPNLMKRPILIVDDEVLLGFDADRWKEILAS